MDSSTTKELITLKGLFGLQLDPENETVIRPSTIPFPLLPANPNFINGVGSRDVVISDSPSIWARIFLPEIRRDKSSDNNNSKKLPVILYFHGGAFVMLSPAVSFYHYYCEKIARKANAVVVSVDYRLTPENRLPAAYDDALTALNWLKTQATQTSAELVDPWLASYADFSKCFVMGDSAGGNIAHHLGVNSASADVKPVHVRGLVLVQPMVGGLGKVRSEVVADSRGQFSVETSNWLWKLALPRGSDMTHPFCDVATAVLGMEGIKLPCAMVVLGGQDWMHDRQFEYVASLRKSNKEVELIDYEHAKHGFFIYDGEETAKFLRSLASFIDKRCKS